MNKYDLDQPAPAHINLAVADDQLSVAHWRKQLTEKITQFPSVTNAAEQLGAISPVFAGLKGYFSLVSAVRGRASLTVTATAVKLIDSLFAPNTETPAPPSPLHRQGLNPNS